MSDELPVFEQDPRLRDRVENETGMSGEPRTAVDALHLFVVEVQGNSPTENIGKELRRILAHSFGDRATLKAGQQIDLDPTPAPTPPDPHLDLFDRGFMLLLRGLDWLAQRTAK